MAFPLWLLSFRQLRVISTLMKLGVVLWAVLAIWTGLTIKWFTQHHNKYRKLIGSFVGSWYPSYCLYGIIVFSTLNALAWRVREQWSSKLMLLPSHNHWYFLVIVVNAILAHVHFLVSIIVLFLVLSERGKAPTRLKSSLSHYAKDHSIKVLIDRMQIEFRCCGKDSFEDWFDFNWYDNTDFMADLNSDDVPFSCCSYAVHLPCLHHGLNIASESNNNGVGKGSTLWSRGCFHGFLIPFYSKLVLMCSTMSLLCALEVLLSAGDRIMQTADGNSFCEDAFVAWLLGEEPSEKAVKEILADRPVVRRLPLSYKIIEMPPPEEIEQRKGVLIIRAPTKKTKETEEVTGPEEVLEHASSEGSPKSLPEASPPLKKAKMTKEELYQRRASLGAQVREPLDPFAEPPKVEVPHGPVHPLLTEAEHEIKALESDRYQGHTLLAHKKIKSNLPISMRNDTEVEKMLMPTVKKLRLAERLSAMNHPFQPRNKTEKTTYMKQPHGGKEAIPTAPDAGAVKPGPSLKETKGPTGKKGDSISVEESFESAKDVL